MKKILALTLLTGCARFSTVQTDISSTDSYGQPTRTITTKASSYAIFEANSKLSQWKATQTDKSQGASVGGLEQSASATNAVAILEAIGKIMSAMPK